LKNLISVLQINSLTNTLYEVHRELDQFLNTELSEKKIVCITYTVFASIL